MDPASREPRATCVNCGAVLSTETCARCGRPRTLSLDYLSKIETLARTLVEEAGRENSFELYAIDLSKLTPLQKSIGAIARQILYWHYDGDGCLGHGERPRRSNPAAQRAALLGAIDRFRGEALRKNWGTDRPSPGKLIREGLGMAQRCVEAVPLNDLDYLGTVLKSLKQARDQQDACGISDDGWRDEDGYITGGIMSVYREAEKLKGL